LFPASLRVDPDPSSAVAIDTQANTVTGAEVAPVRGGRPSGVVVARVESPAMEALAILVAVGVVAVALCGWLAGSRPGMDERRVRSSSARSDPLGLRSASEIVEAREALEAEDLAQLLEACNERRRRRGEAERTVEDVELQLSSERHDAWPAA
jgi:hypothetical protein